MIRNRLKKLLMPPDTFERHQLVARMSGEAATLLDVGGNRGELALFMPETEVTTVNIAGEEADYHFDGGRLPFDDSSFDVAVSLDVLEHIPRAQRRSHLEELLRVARDQVVLCCPLGTPEHVAAERDLAAWYRSATGVEHRFLAEHLEQGLPTEPELRDLQNYDRDGSILFHGDFRKANEAFRLSTSLRTNPSIASLIAYTRRRLDPRRELELSEVANRFSNRAFLLLSAKEPSKVPH